MIEILVFFGTLTALMGLDAWREYRSYCRIRDFNPADHAEEIEAAKREIMAEHRERMRDYRPMIFTYEMDVRLAPDLTENSK